MTINSRFEDLLWNQRFTMLVMHLLASLMLVCLVVPVITILQRLVPLWDYRFMLPLYFFLSLEAMFAWRKLRGVIFTEPYWIIYRLVEWVIILLMIRMVIYAQDGFAQFLAELPAWGKSFTQSFFTVEFMIALLPTPSPALSTN